MVKVLIWIFICVIIVPLLPRILFLAVAGVIAILEKLGLIGDLDPYRRPEFKNNPNTPGIFDNSPPPKDKSNTPQT